MKYLLDTCVVSELMKPAPNGGVVQWARCFFQCEDRHVELLHMITKATPLDGLKVRVEFDDGDSVWEDSVKEVPR